MKYRFLNKEYFGREDAKDINTILIKESGRQFYVNSVGKYIFEIIQKYSNTEDVLNELYSTFPDISERIIKSDFEDIFNIFCLYELVDYDDNDLEEKYTNTPLIRFAGDGDYKKVLNFLLASETHNKNSTYFTSDLKNVTPVALRFTTFHNHNYFCNVYDDNDKILISIAVKPPQLQTTVAGISGIVYTKKLKEQEFIELFEKAVKVITRKMVDITKLRYNFLVSPNNKIDSNYINMLTKIKFYKEFELLKENFDQTLISYTRNIL